jgi:hypothetical protein
VEDLAEEQAEHDAGCAGQNRPDEEGRGDDPVGVDAHHRRPFAVIRRGAHRLPDPRPGNQHGKRDAQPHGDAEDEQLDQLDVHPMNNEDGIDQRSRLERLRVRGAEDERVVGAELGPEEQEGAVLKEEGDAERADQWGNPGRVTQRPVGKPLDDDAEEAGGEHRGQEHEQDQRRERDVRRERAAEHREDAVPDKRADHVHVAVREIQQLEDAVHHRVADRDQRVEAAQRYAADGELDEELGVERERKLHGQGRFSESRAAHRGDGPHVSSVEVGQATRTYTPLLLIR